MRDRVFVTGASGFVGQAVVRRLLGGGRKVTALVHRKDLQGDPAVRGVTCSLFDAAGMAKEMADCVAVIHLVGILREVGDNTFQRVHVEATRAIVEAATLGGVGRLVHMSALGARENAESAYHRSKFEAERVVRASTLAWTIFRPSLILGEGGGFSEMERAMAERRMPPYLLMPYFARGVAGWRGGGVVQPVAVGDVARAIVEAIDHPATVGQVFEVGGDRRMTWPELHRMMTRQIVGRERWTLPVPAWVARLMTRVVPGKWLAFTRDQVAMSLEDNTCDMEPFRACFGWVPGGGGSQGNG